MYSQPKVFDHKIVAVNRGNVSNEANEIIYKDSQNKLHVINLETCAKNFQKEYPTSSGRCIGDRNITSGYFVFYTSGSHTILSFKRFYVFNIFGRKLLSGNRRSRFMKFQKLISETKYTTYDLS